MNTHPLPPLTHVHWCTVRVRARLAGTDHCTGVADFFTDCCDEHDLHYRTGRWVDDGTPITRAEADARFRACMQARSKLGRYSPMAFWRWLGVRCGGGRSWARYRAAERAKKLEGSKRG